MSFQNKVLKFLIGLTNNPKQEVTHLDLRKNLEASSSFFCKPPKDLIVEKTTVHGRDAEWITTGSMNKAPVVLYFHGGAYVAGSINSHRNFVGQICHRSNTKGFIVDFRLAPESPFPAAFEDTFQAYKWLLEGGHNPKNVVIAGDSSGAGLALAVMMRARDEGLPLPAAGVLLSPWLDLTASGESLEFNRNVDPFLRQSRLEEWGAMYVGSHSAKQPTISPLFGDFKGLPPLSIYAASTEIILSDAIRMQEMAKLAGVETQLNVGKELFHVWPLFANILPEARQSIQEISAFISQKVR